MNDRTSRKEIPREYSLDLCSCHFTLIFEFSLKRTVASCSEVIEIFNLCTSPYDREN